MLLKGSTYITIFLLQIFFAFKSKTDFVKKKNYFSCFSVNWNLMMIKKYHFHKFIRKTDKSKFIFQFTFSNLQNLLLFTFIIYFKCQSTISQQQYALASLNKVKSAILLHSILFLLLFLIICIRIDEMKMSWQLSAKRHKNLKKYEKWNLSSNNNNNHIFFFWNDRNSYSCCYCCFSVSHFSIICESLVMLFVTFLFRKYSSRLHCKHNVLSHKYFLTDSSL